MAEIEAPIARCPCWLVCGVPRRCTPSKSSLFFSILFSRCRFLLKSCRFQLSTNSQFSSWDHKKMVDVCRKMGIPLDETAEPVLFHGGIFSQWHKADFKCAMVVGDDQDTHRSWTSNEQYMMAGKVSGYELRERSEADARACALCPPRPAQSVHLPALHPTTVAPSRSSQPNAACLRA